MAQVKIYGLKDKLNPCKLQLSEVIHSCVVDALQFPVDKRAHRFFPLETEDFYYPVGRSPAYTIIEITMMTGRSIAAKKKLVRLLYERCHTALALAVQDLEVCIIESPAHNWGFRGMHGDEIKLDYKIEV